MLQTSCGEPLQQSLPQSTVHLALAVYDNITTCEQVREPTVRSNSYTREINLEFVGVDNPRAWALPYHICTDTTWDVSLGELLSSRRVGPVDTFVWWYNPCNTTESLTYNISRVPDGAPLLAPWGLL